MITGVEGQGDGRLSQARGGLPDGTFNDAVSEVAKAVEKKLMYLSKSCCQAIQADGFYLNCPLEGKYINHKMSSTL